MDFTIPQHIRDLLVDIDARKVKPRILTLTQSTYDGVLYNTDTIKHSLDGYIDTLHFDEAWLPHAAFHPLYGGFHAMGRYRERPTPLVRDAIRGWRTGRLDFVLSGGFDLVE